MKFIHAVVYDKDEFESILSEKIDLTDWGIVCDGDYVIHALYDCEKQAVLTLNDDTHTHIVDEIASFCQGIRYCGNEVEIIKAYVVMNKDENAYSWKQVCEHLANGDYVEVID